MCLGAPAKLQRPGNARTGPIWVLLKSAQLSWTYLQLEVTAAQVLDKYWQIRQCHKNTTSSTRHTSSFNSHSVFVLRLAASALSVAMMKSVSLALHLLYRKHTCMGRVSTFGLSCSHRRWQWLRVSTSLPVMRQTKEVTGLPNQGMSKSPGARSALLARLSAGTMLKACTDPKPRMMHIWWL